MTILGIFGDCKRRRRRFFEGDTVEDISSKMPYSARSLGMGPWTGQTRPEPFPV